MSSFQCTSSSLKVYNNSNVTIQYMNCSLGGGGGADLVRLLKEKVTFSDCFRTAVFVLFFYAKEKLKT